MEIQIKPATQKQINAVEAMVKKGRQKPEGDWRADSNKAISFVKKQLSAPTFQNRPEFSKPTSKEDKPIESKKQHPSPRRRPGR